MADAPELKVHLEEDFFQWPTHIWPSEAGGVDVNAAGHIFLLNRGNVPLLEFAPDGSYIGSHGEGFNIIHAARSVRFDRDDNMWLVDSGNNVTVHDPVWQMNIDRGASAATSHLEGVTYHFCAVG